jgi:hypothetical protein
MVFNDLRLCQFRVLPNRIYHRGVTVRNFFDLLEFNQLHGLRESRREPVTFGNLKLSPFLHREEPSDLASTTDNNVIKRAKHGVFKRVTKGVNING